MEALLELGGRGECPIDAPAVAWCRDGTAASARRRSARCSMLASSVAAGRALPDIEAALTRIESGCYGRCVCCRGSIRPSRLSAMPTATECSSCRDERLGRGRAAA
ncbi:MAG: TraR/DksA family transcriptional regulator [Actinomycetota bacterium]|nr:TraR/DksA family transcriptional regulator [Actinomycetota bacterium]